jgi:quinol monooxygenase YgiN
MYGTVARFRAKPGMADALRELSESYDAERAPGYVSQTVYQMDDDPNVFYIAVVFESREAYVANAESEDQHERYLEMREMLAGDPEWHDGEIIFNDA